MVFVAFFGLTTTLTVVGFVYHYRDFSYNSRKGFETRGTHLANERLILQELIRSQASISDILKFQKRSKREIISNTPDRPFIDTNENITVNFDEYGVDYEPKPEEMNSPCLQYAGIVRYNVSGFSDLLSKAIFEITSFDQLFQIETLKQLCMLDSLIEEEFAKEVIDANNFRLTLGKFTLKYSFHLPYYMGCFSNFSYSKSCETLTQADANGFKEQLMQCLDPMNKTKDLLCKSSIAKQLSTYVLQKQNSKGTVPSGSIYISAILPIRLYGNNPKELDFYTNLWHKLASYYSDKPHITLKGLVFNIKDAIFERVLFSDMYLGCLALLLISLAIFGYSKSVFFTFIIIFGMLLSIGASFFIYSMILGITFFPFINLLVLIIAVAVGADDAFLLASQYKREKMRFEQMALHMLNTDLSSMPRSEQKTSSYELTETWMVEPVRLDANSVHHALERALGHAAIAMFVTTATTAVAFFTNYFSNILVLKCFGIFAGITILTNYVFVVTALPASILMLEKFACSTFESRSSCRPVRSFIKFIKNLYCYKLPLLVHKLSIPISLSAAVVGGCAIYVNLMNPGIRLPENNPLQILRSSNPFEWFAENERSLFDFSTKREIYQVAYAIFGVLPTKDASDFIVDDVGTISEDPTFNLSTLSAFQSMEKLIFEIAKLDFLKIPNPNVPSSWLTSFLFWAKSCNSSEYDCCGLNELSVNYPYDKCFLEYAGKEPPMPMPQDLYPLGKPFDGPIFDKKDGKFLGYYFAAPTTSQYVLIYEDLKPIFKNLEKIETLTRKEGKLRILAISLGFPHALVLSTPYSTQIFDILNTLLNGTMWSVLASIAVSAVVVVLTTWRPILAVLSVICISWAIVCIIAVVLLFGWTINVFEATVIVLTIGLSFDYTLHIAVAYKTAPDFVVKEKVVYAVENVGIPVFLSSATNFLAGIALIWSQTQAFFEIGVFFITMTIISFIAALIVFPALIFAVAKCCKRI